jgi:hypothetical protein
MAGQARRAAAEVGPGVVDEIRNLIKMIGEVV